MVCLLLDSQVQKLDLTLYEYRDSAPVPRCVGLLSHMKIIFGRILIPPYSQALQCSTFYKLDDPSAFQPRRKTFLHPSQNKVIGRISIALLRDF